MIDGITVLAQESVVEYNMIAPFLWLLGLMVGGLLLGTLISKIAEEDWPLIAGIIFGCIFGLVAFVWQANISIPTGEYKYKVTIDETVPLVEFYERYEIINQDGMIYEIRERGD